MKQYYRILHNPYHNGRINQHSYKIQKRFWIFWITVAIAYNKDGAYKAINDIKFQEEKLKTNKWSVIEVFNKE